MADGTAQIADNADAFAPGIDELIDQTSRLAENLQRSESYLNTVNRQANTAEAGGFLPAGESPARPTVRLRPRSLPQPRRTRGTHPGHRRHRPSEPGRPTPLRGSAGNSRNRPRTNA